MNEAHSTGVGDSESEIRSRHVSQGTEARRYGGRP